MKFNSLVNKGLREIEEIGKCYRTNDSPESRAAHINAVGNLYAAQIQAVAISEATDKLVACLNKISQQ